MSDFGIVQKRFPGGLRAVMLPRADVQTVTFMVLIGVGSRYETARQNGLSHFLEHMFFKGTEKRPTTKEISEAVDNVGGEFNAFTGEEYTGYFVKVAMEHLETGADVVSDILLRPLFPPEEIERERGVIIEEIRMYTDMPMQHVKNLWQQTLYGEHALGRDIAGTPESVSAFKRKDFQDYVKKHYHTENAVVVVAGNFQPKKLEKLLGTLFKPLAKGSETHPKGAPKKLAQRFVHEKRESLDQSHMIVGVPGVSMSDNDRWAADLLAVVLGGGMSSRMFLQVRERHGLAYAVRTESDNMTDTGSFVTQAVLRTDKSVDALKMMLEEYDRVMDEPVPEAELKKAKQIVRGHMVRDLEETNSLAMFAGGQELLRRKVMTPDMIWKQFQQVTAKDVQSVARKLLDPSRRAVAMLSPHTSTKAFENLL